MDREVEYIRYESNRSQSGETDGGVEAPDRAQSSDRSAHFSAADDEITRTQVFRFKALPSLAVVQSQLDSTKTAPTFR